MDRLLIVVVVLVVFAGLFYATVNRRGDWNPTAQSETSGGPHHARHLSQASFANHVLENRGVVLVDFWAPWCGPCVRLGPTIEELADEYDGRVLVAKLNVDEAQDIALRYDITGIPALLYFRNGELVDRQVGYQSRGAIADKLDELIAQ